MEPIPYPGCYQCPRCNSRDVYIGEKTLSATAILNLKKFDSRQLYDEKFTDGTVKGALGKMGNYQGYISFNPADNWKKITISCLTSAGNLCPLIKR